MELKVANIIDPVTLKDMPDNITKLVADMKAFLRGEPKASYCIPSFIDGENLAILVLRAREKRQEKLITLINPTVLSNNGIIASEEIQYGVEGTYLLQRSPKILYAGIALLGMQPIQAEILGRTALTIQQACDALRGVSIDVLGIRIDDFPEYQNGTQEDKTEVFKALIDELRERKNALHSEETEQYVKATEFVAEKLERSVAIEATIDVTKRKLARQENKDVRAQTEKNNNS